jgi:hypothetical protein
MFFTLYLGRGMAFELDLFRTIHPSWSEWSLEVSGNCVLTKVYDHCPKANFLVILGRWKLIEIGVYNVHHRPDDDEVPEAWQQ